MRHAEIIALPSQTPNIQDIPNSTVPDADPVQNDQNRRWYEQFYTSPPNLDRLLDEFDAGAIPPRKS